MPADKEFPNGLYVQAPRPSAPDFVKGRVSIQMETFIEYLAKKIETGEEWLRVDVKEGFNKDEEGNPKWYAQVDNWKPATQMAPEEDTDVDPF